MVVSALTILTLTLWARKVVVKVVGGKIRSGLAVSSIRVGDSVRTGLVVVVLSVVSLLLRYALISVLGASRKSVESVWLVILIWAVAVCWMRSWLIGRPSSNRTRVG